MTFSFELRILRNRLSEISLKSADGQTLLRGGGFRSKCESERQIGLIKSSCELEGAYEVKTSVAGKLYFYLITPGGEIVGIGRLHSTLAELKMDIGTVKENARLASVTVVNEEVG